MKTPHRPTWVDRLRQLTRERDLSQADIARICRCRTSSVSAWFAGDVTELKATHLLRLCEFLRVDPWWFQFGGRRPDRFKEYIVAQETRLPPWVEEDLEAIAQMVRDEKIGEEEVKLLRMVAGRMRRDEEEDADG